MIPRNRTTMNRSVEQLRIMFLIIHSVFMTGLTGAQNLSLDIPFEVDQKSYLLKHDIVYRSPAYQGFEGFPMGNGDLGGMVWCTPGGLKIQINKSDTYDQPNEETRMVLRSCGRLDIDFGAPCFDWIHLKEFEGRLSLYDAEASFATETPFMSTRIKSVVAVDENVWLIECKKTEQDRHLDGTRVRIGLERWGSRTFPGWYGRYHSDPEIGLGKAETGVEGSVIFLTEEFEGLNFALACKLLGQNSKGKIISRHRAELESEAFASGEFSVLVAVATSRETAEPLQKVKSMLEGIDEEQIAILKSGHRKWWESFWQRSFVHLPDDYIENIYYVKRYLLASSSRSRYPALFNASIFTWNHDIRNWVTPHHWNMQQIYWGILPSGDYDLLEPYLNTYYRLMPEAEEHALMRGAKNSILWSEAHDYEGRMTFWDRADMLNNFTPASQVAGFFWDYYKYTGNIEFLKSRGYPFMKKAAEFYLQTLQWDEDKNEFFIDPSQPYESPRANNLRNPITDRNMIASLFGNCITASGLLQSDRPKQKEWQHVIDHLWDPPMRDVPDVGEVFELAFNSDGSVYPGEKETGDWIFHFSGNTSIVFPAGLVGLDQKESRYFNAAARLIKLHPDFRNAITPDPIVAARLGMADESLRMITNSIRRLQHFPQGLFYNIDHWHIHSIYADSLKKPEFSAQRDYIYDSRNSYTGSNSSGLPTGPFIQCGLEPLGSLGAAVNEMLLQSHEGKIRLFPATPNGWPVAFTLHAEGSFTVSATRQEDGVIPALGIHSLAGNVCRLQNPWPGQQPAIWEVSGSRKPVRYKETGEGVIVFKTSKDVRYLLGPPGFDGTLEEKPLFKGERNLEPKHFQEAILGKERNF